MTEFLAVWRDGVLREEASVDPGHTLGMGVFETLLVMGGRTLARERHLRRLTHGAKLLGLPALRAPELHDAVTTLAALAPNSAHARLRLTWTGGPRGAGRLLGTLAHYHPLAEAAVEISRFRRNETSAVTGIKCTSFAENILALREANAAGADEALLANTRGELAEGATSNVFIETPTELLTPPLESGCLPGITRELCLEWGRAAGLPIRETPIPVDVMNTTAHAALTSALKGVMPVTRVGARALEVGPLTRELAQIYRCQRKLSLDPQT